MTNRYAAYLSAAGIDVCNVDGHSWQRYQGVLIPAYLPHAVPPYIGNTAKVALKRSGALLARWTERLDNAPDSDWWYVLRDGAYDKRQLSSNTRSKLNRGGRRLETRQVPPGDLIREGYPVCEAASQRYGTDEFLPQRSDFEQRVRAAQEVACAVEFWGVYRGDQLLAFSENHIQDNAVFMERIWYDPDGLRDYSSYVLMDAILEEYLNRRKFDYISDGSRSIYHETGVHDFLIDKFGYRRAHAVLKVAYRPFFGMAVHMARGFMPLISAVPQVRSLRHVRRLEALMLQHRIAH